MNKQEHIVAPLSAPLFIKIMYALGQLGWALAVFGVGNLLPYYYLPPESGDTVVFPVFIYQGYILGFITVIGLIGFGGRVFDAFTDPLIANWSDRSTSKLGKRRLFMAIAILPFALFSFLIFLPISSNIMLNQIWLWVSVFLLYFFMTMYVTPYTALISELGHNSKDRLLISTLISVTFIVGTLMGMQIYGLMEPVKQAFNCSQAVAFRYIIAAFAIVAAFFMALPVIFVNEKKYCLPTKSDAGSWSSIQSVFKHVNFRYFLFSDLIYWLSLTFVQMGLIYYVTILLQLQESYTDGAFTLMVALSFLYYIPINYLAQKFGKKPLLIVGFLLFTATFLLIFFMGRLPLPNTAQIYLLSFLASMPMALFGILPNVIIADIAEDVGKKTGNYQAGMFFAVRTFMMKLGISLANLLFPSLILLGKSVENDIGIRLTGLTAGIICILGLLIFLKYNDVEGTKA